MSGLRKIVTAWRNGGVRQFGVVSDGADGVNGWTPILVPEQDGARTLLKVLDWVIIGGAKPDAGLYLTPTGYVPNKAQGVATFDLSAHSFTAVPSVVALPATTAVLSGPTRSIVSAVSKTSATVTVQQQAILTGIVSLLAGATANIFVVEQ